MKKHKVARNEPYWLYGWHVVKKALENPQRRSIELAFLPTREKEVTAFYKTLPQSLQLTRVDRHFFRKIFSENSPHQGVALRCSRLPEQAFEDFLYGLSGKTVILVLDNVEDPRNIGAVLRSAAAFGACALMLAGNKMPRESAVMAKAASGALEQVPIVRPVNLARALDQLKQAGFWCIAFDERGESLLHKMEFSEKTALVFGGEGKGLRRLTVEKCDIIARIDMENALNLNISNAAAIALYACYRYIDA